MSVLSCRSLALAGAGAAFSLLAAGTAFAVLPQPADKIDAARFGPARRTASARAAAGAAQPLAVVKSQGWTLRLDPQSGAVRSMAGAVSRPYGGGMESAARAFLQDQRAVLRIDPERLKLSLQRSRGGLAHLWFEQSYQGLPIEFGRVSMHLTLRGEVVQVDSNFEPDPKVSLAPSLSEGAAAAAASADLGAPVLRPGSLVLLPTDAGLRLAWKFDAAAGAPLGHWAYYVDAQAGAILLRYNRYEFVQPSCANASNSSGTISGLVYDLDPNPKVSSAPVARPMAHERVFIDSANFAGAVLTAADGTYCGTAPGRIFTLLRGPYANVFNHHGRSAYYDNGGGQWFGDPTAVASSPHPYANSTTASQSVSVPAGPRPALVMPQFSRFVVGALAGSSSEGFSSGDDDDELSILNPADPSHPVARYNGNQGGALGLPFFGAPVEGSTYTLRLEANASGVQYGYDVALSSYLVLTSSGFPDFPSASFVWRNPTTTVNASSFPGVTMDGTANQFGPDINQINLFYQINRMHDFFDSTVNASGEANIEVPVPAASHFGPDIANAFYNPDKKALYFGDVLDAFDKDATIIHHEYTHFLVDQIYPIINFGQGGAISEGNADYFSGSSLSNPGIAAYFEMRADPNQQNYAPIRTMNPTGGPANGDCALAGPSNNSRSFRGDWCGEVHIDGMILSQSLWLLRSSVSVPTAAYYLGPDPSSGLYKADVLAFDTLFFFPDSFEGYLQSMLTAAKNRGYPQGDLDKINAAFNLHGVSTGTIVGDVYEPNDGPATATDLAKNNPVSATIYPAGDLDFYSLSAVPGAVGAVLQLPPGKAAGTYLAYQMRLYDSKMNLVAKAPPPFDINPTASSNCQMGVNCLTSVSSVTLSYSVPAAGQYYLLVCAGDNDLGSVSMTSSTAFYTLTVAYASRGTASAGIVSAVFDRDVLSFTVPVSSYVQSAYQFAYAQLRDQGLSAMPNTRTDQAGAYLAFLSSGSAPGAITGRLQVAPGFDARFPAVGSVYLEIYGSHAGIGPPAAVSLGLSQALFLTQNSSQGDDFKGWNNLFAPGKSSRATFRWQVASACEASVMLYAVDGSPVRTLFDQPVPAGKGAVDWDGTNDSGSKVASGVYFVRFQCGSFTKVQKAVVVK